MIIRNHSSIEMKAIFNLAKRDLPGNAEISVLSSLKGAKPYDPARQCRDWLLALRVLLTERKIA
jgi:hypothetical protein